MDYFRASKAGKGGIEMSNMSYCRFRNTLIDLQDCYYHLFDDEVDNEELSLDEKKAREKLIALCHNIAWDTNFGEDEEEE